MKDPAYFVKCDFKRLAIISTQHEYETDVYVNYLVLIKDQILNLAKLQ